MASLYTVTFVSPVGDEDISRYFETLRAARKWAAWLISRPSMAAKAKIYRGSAGSELLEERVA